MRGKCSAMFVSIRSRSCPRTGRPECVLIGPAEERWDAAFIAVYPNAAAFLEMVTDPDYRRAVVHRQAAVQTSRLIRMAPRDAGTGLA